MNESIWIPEKQMLQTERFLKLRGKAGKEGLVLWAGWQHDPLGSVVLMCVRAGEEWPHGVQLGFKQLLSLTKLLAQNQLVLIAQVHNHPGRIPHSQADEEHPASHKSGYLSIVVPQMGVKGINLAECLVYEYQRELRWREWDKAEKAARVTVIPDGVRI